ncbi:MAG: apolipoprotein N-acyltransferase [Candidatus Alcyoniella australis]|nr:apolipoprotein N-acyltransferase [Candidatus Alcyoniella australis]
MKPLWRYLLTAISALAAAAVFPRLELYHLAWFALIPALAAIPGAGRKQAFWLGFVFNVINKGCCCYWLVYTINYYGEFPLIVALLVFALLLAAMGVLFALPWYLLGRIVNELRVPLVVAAPIIWTAYELLISRFLGGFPWTLYGYGLWPDLYACQLADVISVYGLSLCLVLINACLAQVAFWIARNRRSFPAVAVIVAVLTVVALYAYGLWRVPQIQRAIDGQTELRVGVVQGNIDQFEKRAGDRNQILDKYRALSMQAAVLQPDLIVWPETSVPGYQNRRKRPRPFVVELVKEVGVPMLLGMPSKYVPTRETRVNYNSAYLYSAQGQVLGSYDKNHMVPFGEFVPLKPWLRVVAPEQAGRTLGFSPSGKYNVIKPAPGPLGVIICYEAIYPGHGLRLARMGIDYFVNITNDVWFGDTSAPPQHLRMTAMRAIENRRWIVRAANTGISALIDPLGRISNATDYRVDAQFVGTIGRLRIQTLFQRIGLLIPALCSLAALLAIAILAARGWGIWGLLGTLALAGAGLWLYSAQDHSAGLLVIGVGLWLVQRARLIQRGRKRSFAAFIALGLIWPFFGWVGWGVPFALGLFAFQVLPALALGRMIARRRA